MFWGAGGRHPTGPQRRRAPACAAAPCLSSPPWQSPRGRSSGVTPGSGVAGPPPRTTTHHHGCGLSTEPTSQGLEARPRPRRPPTGSPSVCAAPSCPRVGNREQGRVSGRTGLPLTTSLHPSPSQRPHLQHSRPGLGASSGSGGLRFISQQRVQLGVCGEGAGGEPGGRVGLCPAPARISGPHTPRGVKWQLRSLSALLGGVGRLKGAVPPPRPPGAPRARLCVPGAARLGAARMV